MKHRLLLLAAVGVVVLLAALAVIVRMALGGAGLRAFAERELTRTLGQPVRIGALDLSVFPRPVAVGRDLVVGADQDTQQPAVTLAAVRIVPRLSSLLSQPVVIDELRLEGLALHVRRDAAGNWILPLPLETTSGNRPPGDRSVQVLELTLRDGSVRITGEAGGPPVVVDRIEARAGQRDAGTTDASFTAAVGATLIRGTAASDASGARVHLESDSLGSDDIPSFVALAGGSAPEGLAIGGQAPLTLDLAVAPGSGALTVSGEFGAETLTLDTLTLETVKAPIRLENSVLRLDPLTFHAYGGTETGRLTIDLSDTPARWAFTSSVDRLDVNRFLTANTTAKDTLSGVARVSADLRGRAGVPVEDGLTGTIRAAIDDGVVRNLPLLGALNTALRITGGNVRDTEFRRLSASLSVANGRATSDDLRLEAGEVTVVARVALGYDRSIDARGVATFTRAKSLEIVRSVQEFRALRNSAGEVQVPVRVYGTIADPQVSVDVAEALKRGVTNRLEREIKRLLPFP